MTIKVKEITRGCSPVIFDCGDWFDLCTAEEVTLKAPYANTKHKKKHHKTDSNVEVFRDVVFDSTLIRLGVAMEIPKGFEAVVIPRSSTFKKFGLLQSNSEGLIDFLYKGDNDEWKMPVVATRNITIPKGTRLCQFRIQLSQKATVWQKLKWLFSGAPRLQHVETLGNPTRGGFGSTGY